MLYIYFFFMYDVMSYLPYFLFVYHIIYSLLSIIYAAGYAAFCEARPQGSGVEAVSSASAQSQGQSLGSCEGT